VCPRYVAADPFEGGKQAVAECWRNLTAVGSLPLALTDNLNFGSPERPEVMGQFVRAVAGIAEACHALDFPVVSGNVSLYNETDGRAILPTPAIGGVGLLEDWRAAAALAFKAEGEAVLLAGAPHNWGAWLGQSLYLRELHGLESGSPPPVDLAQEKRVGDFVRGAIRDGLVTAAHDLADGGLAVALAEMAMASGIGASLELPEDAEPVAALFGEDQNRYLLTVTKEAQEILLRRSAAAGISLLRIGKTGGAQLRLGELAQIAVSELRDRHEGWFPVFMGEA
jgi:phosphoribosylformylglycinamidine synthase